MNPNGRESKPEVESIDVDMCVRIGLAEQRFELKVEGLAAWTNDAFAASSCTPKETPEVPHQVRLLPLLML